MKERAVDFLKIASKDRDSSKGRLKIILGMVAGVGKTYAMLNLAHQQKKNGIDVVIGYLESHGRKETDELAEGLQYVERTKIQYKGKILEEMDLDKIIERKPQVALVDELAHTNIPGSKHVKRYQDVLDILNAGIDVYTTLNIQHLESCALIVHDITGVVVTETLPDSVIEEADEVILVDLAPEQLIERLLEGKIYAPEKIQSSLDNFFTRNNLVALRELVLRILSDKVTNELKNINIVRGIPQIWKTSFNLLVPIDTASDDAEYLIRKTKRIAAALNASWTVAFISTKKNTPFEQAAKQKDINLARQLGANVETVDERSYRRAVWRLLHNHLPTHLVLPAPPSFWSYLYRILMKIGVVDRTDVDIIWISSPKTKKSIRIVDLKPFASVQWRWKNLFLGLSGLGLLTWGFTSFPGEMNLDAICMIYLIFVVLFSLFSSTLNIVLVGLTASMLINFFFTPPVYTFLIHTLDDWVTLSAFVVAALVTGIFTTRLRNTDYVLKRDDEKLNVLYFLTRDLLKVHGLNKQMELVIDKISRLYNIRAGIFLPLPESIRELDRNIVGGVSISDKEFSVAVWVFSAKKSAGKFTSSLPSSEGTYLPIVFEDRCFGVLCIVPNPRSGIGSQHVMIFEDMARQLAVAMDREIATESARKTQVKEATEKAYQTFLNSVSHELKTPLAAISGSATSLMDDEVALTPSASKQLAKEIVVASNRMRSLVQNLLDMGRIEYGNVKLRIDKNDIRDVIANILNVLRPFYPAQQVKLDYAHDVPQTVHFDAALIEQALKNIIQNAFQYAPDEKPIEIGISTSKGGYLNISIRDFGPGLPKDDPNMVFQKFYRFRGDVPGGSGLGLTIAKAFVELHEGQIFAQNAVGGGAVFTVRIPIYGVLPENRNGEKR